MLGQVMRRWVRGRRFKSHLRNLEARWNPDSKLRVGQPVDQYVDELMSKGIVILKDFLDSGTVSVINQEIELISRDNLPAEEYKSSGNSFRIYKIQDKCPSVARLLKEKPIIESVPRAYYGGRLERVNVMFQESRPSEMAPEDQMFGVSGFHFDNIADRLKLMIYLTDVELENGPFTYVFGSSDINSYGKLRKMRRQYVEGATTADSYDHTYYSRAEEEQYRLNEIAQPITGSRGDAMFVSTRGLHKARRIESGVRRVLVFYLR